MNYRRQEDCKACESEITERPVQLPCKDIICVKCYNELAILETRECPVCQNKIPAYFNPRQDNTEEWDEYAKPVLNQFEIIIVKWKEKPRPS